MQPPRKIRRKIFFLMIFPTVAKYFFVWRKGIFSLLPPVLFAVQAYDISSSSSVGPDWPSDISYIDLCTDFILRISASLIS